MNTRRLAALVCAASVAAFLAPSGTARSIEVTNPWNLDRINQATLPLDGNVVTGALNGAGVDIYVVDTGVRPTHEQLNGRVVAGLDIPTKNGTAAVTPVSSDCDGHGTHVASTAAGTTTGVAPGATVVSVRVLDCNGDGEVADVVDALEWVLADHKSGRAAVANLSLGVDLGDNGTTIIEMVHELVADGIVVVVAAGNGDASGRGIDACRIAPGSEPMSFTVGAVSKTDAVTSYSNYGPCVDLWAPGGDRGNPVVAAWFRTDSDYMGDIGTSMAAPLASGALALLAQQQPALCPAQYTDALVERSTKDVITGMDGTSFNRLLRVDTAPVASLSVPGRPSNVVVTPDNSSLLVAWDAPCDGGSPLTGYTVSALRKGKVVKRVTVDGTRTAARIKGLTNGVGYSVVVKPANAVGPGTATRRISPVTAGGLRIGRRWDWSHGISTDTGSDLTVKSLSGSRCRVSGAKLVPVSTGTCRFSVQVKNARAPFVRTIVVTR